jgi:glycosyltransferase involved in cell wall biosynthesis
VAVLSWRAPGDPDAGGSELHAREILARWVAAGVEVTVHARRPPVTGRPGGDSSSVLPFDVVHTGGTYGVFAAAPTAVWRARRRFDAVVEILNGVPFWSPLWWQGPRVVWLHHLHTEMWAQTLPRPLADIGRWNERVVVPRVYSSTSVVTLAEPGRTELTHAGFGRVEVVEPGVSEVFTPDSERVVEGGGTRLVAVGRLAPVKRWLELVEAIAPLAARIPGLRLDVVGEGPLRPDLERWRSEHGASWLVLHGRVDDAALRDLYRAADVLVSASSAEGWGMTITEAARCAVPAVVTDVTGHRAAVVDGVTGALVDDPSGLTGTIESLLLDPERRARWGAAAADRARTMIWDEAARRHLEILEAAVAERGRR